MAGPLACLQVAVQVDESYVEDTTAPAPASDAGAGAEPKALVSQPPCNLLDACTAAWHGGDTSWCCCLACSTTSQHAIRLVARLYALVYSEHADHHRLSSGVLLLQVFDRPFLIFIVDTVTQTVLLQGAVTDPTPSAVSS